jgi:hypothetical protein
MRYLLLGIVCLLLPIEVTAEVKLIELQHRPAAEVEVQVRDLLDEGEKVQAAGHHLILVADGESLQAAVKLIEVLDRPLTNLLIRVRQTAEMQQAGKDSSASVYYGTRNGLSTTATTGYSLSNSLSNQEQMLNLVEGGRGLIEIGREIPYTEHWSVVTGDITGYSETTAYKTIATGFWVSPVQVVGDKVWVEVEPYISNAEQFSGNAPPEIEYGQLRTRLLVPVGQWYPLGEQLQHQDKVSRAIISWRSSSGNTNRKLQIRIDPTD